MSTAAETRIFFTPEDLLGLPDDTGFELVDGELVERKVGIESSWVASRLVSRIDRHGEAEPSGWALGAEAGYQCFPHQPGLVRRPDASFIRYGRLPGEILPKGWARIPPDLAVEVVSPNDSVYELDRKLADYERVSIPLVWVVNPDARTAMIYRADGTIRRLHEDDELSGEEVIPGFRCRLREILPAPVPRPEPTTEAGGTKAGA